MLIGVMFWAVVGSYLAAAMDVSAIVGAGTLASIMSLVPMPSGVLGTGALSGVSTLHELQEQRGALTEKLKAINDLSKKEERDLTDEEQSQWDGLISQREALDKKIKRAKQAEQIEQDAAKRSIEGQRKREEEKVVRNYSYAKAIREMASGGAAGLTGLEAEMHQEGVKRAEGRGVDIMGLAIPDIIVNPEQRDLNVTGGTGGDDGGVTVPENIVGFIPALREKLVLESMGATMMTGLSGNISITKQTAKGSAAWETENSDADEQSPKFGDIKMSPKRLAAMIAYSKQLLVQSSLDIEAFVRNELVLAIARELTVAALSGSGTGNQPLGILNTVGIGSVIGGTDGAAPAWDHIVKLETEVAIDDADLGALGYLTNPKVRGKLKRTKMDAGSGIMVWDKGATELNGYKAEVSNLIPSDLDKGASTGVCSSIIYGNWADLLIGQWGGLDLVVDPYTLAGQNKVKVTANSLWDIAIRRAESFAAMKDALTS